MGEVRRTEFGKKGAQPAVTPAEVWEMIQRADELIKYASNRDVDAAYAHARLVLQRAQQAARNVPGAERLVDQAGIRLQDLARREQRS